MTPFTPNYRRAFRLRDGSPRSTASDIDAELQFHLQCRVDELIARGVSEAEARTSAQAEFGDVARYRDAVLQIDRAISREAHMRECIASVWSDLRQAWRGMRAQRAFTVVAVLTLTLGIGATTAAFSAVDGVLLRPLPYLHADRIVHVGERKAAHPGTGGTTSYDNFADWQRLAHSFSAMGLVASSSRTLTGHGDPEQVRMAMVSSGIFQVFHARPMLGRPIVPADNAPSAAPVLVLGYDFWRTKFGGDSSVIGHTVLLNFTPATIVGVLPPGLSGPERLNRPLWSNFVNDASDGRSGRSKDAYALLRPGVSVSRAQGEMTRLSRQLAALYPEDDHAETAIVDPLADRIVGDVRHPLAMLLGASLLVLLIACANLSNLLLARGITRRRELAVRTALGAGRVRIVRQLLTENLLLAFAGCAAGMLAARAALSSLVALGPDVFTRRPPTLDGRVLAVAVGLSVATTLIFGLVPAVRLAPRDPQSALRDGTRATGGAGTARRALATLQLALAAVLLVLSGLVLKSFARVLDVDPGITPAHVLTARITLPGPRYDSTRSTVFYRELAEHVRAMPGARSVAFTSLIPLSGDFDRITIRDIAGHPPQQGSDAPQGDRYVVSPSYFGTMGVRLVRGRLLRDDDGYDGPLVCLVDEVFARHVFGAADPIGQRVRVPDRDGYATIVGVVTHVKTYGLDAESPGQIYLSNAQWPWRWSAIVVRTSGDPRAFAPVLARTVHQLDPDQPVDDMSSMDQLMADLLRGRRFTLTVIGAFAVAAIGLAIVGLYGVIAYGVVQRRREFSVRMALGAQRAAVARLVVADGARIAVAGAVLGAVGAIWAGRLIASLLFGVGPHDAEVLAAVLLGLVAVALGASLIPALRATRVDAAEVLRGD